MSFVVRRFLLLAVALLACASSAWAAAPQDGLLWLKRVNQAARSVNYSGTFSFSSRGREEASRVVHIVDGAGSHERLEALSGPPREIVRNNDEILSYMPQERMVIVDRAEFGRFPGSVATAVGGLLDFYAVRLGSVSRIAGREAQKLKLEPRDNMRYGHELWADVETGLLLKARMLDDKGETIEQFSFVDVTVGSGVDSEAVKSRFSMARNWKTVNARGQDVASDEVKWIFGGLPSGFRQVSQIRRPLMRGGPEAYQTVFSDGLATISVFVETVLQRASTPPSVASAGSMGIYKRMLDEYRVTVIGEVPMPALKRVAEGMELRTR